MAVLSDYQEEEQQQGKKTQQESSNSATSFSFNAVLDPSNPLGFLESAVNFMSKNCNAASPLVDDVKERIKKEKADLKAQEKRRIEKEREKEKEKEREREREEAKKQLIVPNKGNGLDMENYSWGQSLQEVTLSVPVPPGTKSRQICCEITKKTLKVGLKGEVPILEGELFEGVKVDDCFWNLEDQKLVSVLLTKIDGMDWWKSLLKGGPVIDTQKVEPEPSRLSQLDSETRSTIEKMMFDQRQKQMGKPSSQEIENQEMLKKFMAQNPNMDFSNMKNMNNMNMMM